MVKKLSWLLVLSLLLGCISDPLTVSAEENSQTQQISSTVAESDTVSEISVPDTFILNPVFNGKVDEADVKAEIEEIQNNAYAVSFLAEDSYCSTIEEAQVYVREMMVNRINTITFDLPYELYANTDDIFYVIWDGALAHSESCSGLEGDALYFSWTGCKMSASGSSLSMTFTYTVTYDTTLEQEEQMTEALAAIYTALNIDNASEYEKVKAIYNYICDNVDYDYTYVKHAAYDAVMTGEAVCEGYAMLFYRMCKDYDLSVRMIAGTGNGGAHAWNIVRIGSVYYNLDATWDGQDETTRSNYFLKNTEDFVNHNRDTKYDTVEFHAQYPMAEQSWIDYSAFPEALNVTNTAYSFTTLDGGTVTSTAAGKPKVLIFYNSSESYSKNTIKGICERGIDDVDFITIESKGATTETIETFKSTYGNDDVAWAYDTSSTKIMWNYVSAGGLGSIFYPVIAYIDANDKLQAVTDSIKGVSEIESYINYYCYGNASAISIETQPTNQTARDGEAATFKVKAIGNGVSYQWQYSIDEGTTWQNADLTGNQTSTLSVDATANQDGYQFRCVITDGTGNTATSNVVTLTVEGSVTVTITGQPTDQSVYEGETATFTVEASGDGLSYVWQFSADEGETWQNMFTDSTVTQTANLDITTEISQNGYQFRCVITDETDYSLTSDVATLTVFETLELVSQLTDQIKYEDETTTLTVEAKGNGLTYQWQYSLNEGNTWNTLTTTAIGSFAFVTKTRMNGWMFRCVITDARGESVTSNGATLTVLEKLSIVSQPAAQSVKEGETATFTVEASGSGLSYQWQYKNTGTSAWKNSGMTGAKTASLKVEGTTARNGQQYRCVILDETGNQITSEVAMLTVTKVLAIIAQPEDKTVAEGEVAVFDVNAQGIGLSYQWQYKTTGSNVWKNSGMTGAKTASLKVEGTTARNGQQYRCVITDETGNQITSEVAMLIVTKVLAIITQPEDKTVAEGESAVFEVIAQGVGLSYQWQYKGIYDVVWKNSGMPGAKTTSLTVVAETKRNGQQYRCIITDEAGNQMTSEAVTLTLATEMVIVTHPEDKAVAEGENAVFEVEVQGTGLNYQWQYKGIYDVVWKNSGMTGAKAANLTVVAETKRNGQQYRCVITDGAGKQITSEAATLTVITEMAIITQPENRTVMEGENAVFEVVALGTGLSYQWQYKGVYDVVWKNSGMTGAKTASLTVVAETKRNGQQYRCIITDGVGNQVTSTEVTLTVE